MPFSEEDYTQIDTWIAATFADGLHCPLCDQSDGWTAAGMVILPAWSNTQGVHRPTEEIPMVHMLCDGCGYALFFAATVVGLATPQAGL